ncbi:MAG: cytochrome c biogenesis protein ResB, partial [Prevotella sp.]|nr:cytochrome c biogenesis protein ResB [Prevotella sp.]
MIKKTIIALYVLIIVCIGLASIIEKFKGTPYVSENIYGAWWFVILWGLLTVTSLAYIIRQQMYRRIATFLLHMSFVVILAGALITYLSAERGTVNLRVGKPQTVYTDDDAAKQTFPFLLTLKEFKVVYYPGTDAPLDYQSVITVKEDNTTRDIIVSMNNIGEVMGYRLFQSSYDSDNMGVSLGVYHDPWGIGVTYCGYLLL